MKRILMVLVLAAVAVAFSSGCKSHSGSREYIPGKGWIQND